MKAYKVVRKWEEEYGSAIVYRGSKFHKTYSENDLTDEGLVFKRLNTAIQFYEGNMRENTEVWKCECAHIEPVEMVANDATIGHYHKGLKFTKRFGNTSLSPYYHINPLPEWLTDLNHGFGIRLIKKIK
jgi:hypothetical protein